MFSVIEALQRVTHYTGAPFEKRRSFVACPHLTAKALNTGVRCECRRTEMPQSLLARKNDAQLDYVTNFCRARRAAVWN